MKNQQDWVAIIAEFNPFHNGHKYIIEKAKELTGCEHALIIMSPNFVQRGEPAIINKTSRAKFAISCGASAVVQIPTKYAVCNAEVFALAGVQIANSFKCVKYLLFGSECGDIKLIKDIASISVNDSEIQESLKQGISYISAYKKAIIKTLPKASKVLEMPNNILGVEYVKALTLLKSHITPVTTPRIKNNYSQNTLSGEISSATAIRQNLDKCDSAIPVQILAQTKEEFKYKPNMEAFKNICLFAAQTHPSLLNIYNVDNELVNKIKNNPQSSYEDFITAHQTRRYSIARITRILLYSVLGITHKEIQKLYAHKKPPFIKVLAINELCVSKLVNSCKSALILRKNQAPKKCNIEEAADKLYFILTKQKVNKITVFQKT